jgi:hypothetical protein
MQMSMPQGRSARALSRESERHDTGKTAAFDDDQQPTGLTEECSIVAGAAARSPLLLRYSGDPERKRPVGVAGYIETAGAGG